MKIFNKFMFKVFDYSTLSIRRERLNNITAIQCDPSNAGYDPYMHGLANGLIMAKSIMDDTPSMPQFLSAPKVWGREQAKDYVESEGNKGDPRG